jgi:CheY-like chemotaxis protein
MKILTPAGKSAQALRPVVLVDDCPDARFLSSRALKRAGLENPIVTLNGGKEAIAYLRGTCLAAGGRRGERPEMMFLDVEMPDCDGFQVLRWLRRRKAFQKLRVILLTHSEVKPEAVAKLKVDAVLEKYPSPTTLRNLLPPMKSSA